MNINMILCERVWLESYPSAYKFLPKQLDPARERQQGGEEPTSGQQDWSKTDSDGWCKHEATNDRCIENK